jgi:hypothetical protein
MSPQDLVGSMLGEDLITAVRIHLQRRCRATVGFPRDFHTHALVSSGQRCLRLRWRPTESQGCRAQDENFSQGVKPTVVISHRGPQVIDLSGPEGLRQAIGSAFTRKQCKHCAIRVIPTNTDSNRLSKIRELTVKNYVNNSFYHCPGREAFCSHGTRSNGRVGPRDWAWQ